MSLHDRGEVAHRQVFNDCSSVFRIALAALWYLRREASAELRLGEASKSLRQARWTSWHSAEVLWGPTDPVTSRRPQGSALETGLALTQKETEPAAQKNKTANRKEGVWSWMLSDGFKRRAGVRTMMMMMMIDIKVQEDVTDAAAVDPFASACV